MSEILSNNVDIILKKQTWKAAKVTMGDIADFDGFLRAARAKEFTQLTRETVMDPGVIAKVLVEIYTHSFTTEERQEALQSYDGVTFILHRALKPFQPHFTPDTIKQLMKESDQEEIVAAVEAITAGLVGETNFTPPQTLEELTPPVNSPPSNTSSD